MDGRDIEKKSQGEDLGARETEGVRGAWEESVAEDGALLDQIAINRRRNRLKGPIMLLCALFALLCVTTLVLLSGGERGSEERPGSIMSSVPAGGAALDAVIISLEAKLRKPGSEEDYRRLSRAYRTRYERTGETTDLQRSLASLERAEALKRKKEDSMQKNPLIFSGLFLVLIVGLVGLVVMLLYNSLAARDEMVDARWAQVDTVLQRRLDLIPNLVETVKGYAKHETETLTAVTEARGRMLSALGGLEGKAPSGNEALQQVQAARQGLGSALGRLLALVESYPDLKASSSFVGLQDQLEGTENRIAVERMRYNEAVRSLNAKLRLFPHNVVGSLFGFEPRAYFESDLGAEKSLDVKF